MTVWATGNPSRSDAVFAKHFDRLMSQHAMDEESLIAASLQVDETESWRCMFENTSDVEPFDNEDAVTAYMNDPTFANAEALLASQPTQWVTCGCDQSDTAQSDCVNTSLWKSLAITNAFQDISSVRRTRPPYADWFWKEQTLIPPLAPNIKKKQHCACACHAMDAIVRHGMPQAYIPKPKGLKSLTHSALGIVRQSHQGLQWAHCGKRHFDRAVL
jgi:hypothetical protein